VFSSLALRVGVEEVAPLKERDRMRRTSWSRPIAILALVVTAAARADDYVVDPAHTAVTFKVQHLGLSWTHGRFNDVSGTFSFDKAALGSASFALTVKADSIDTGNARRDGHLRSPDFLNVKQFPLLSFRSRSVKAVGGGYLVTGDFTLHGQTKSISFKLQGGKEAQFPPGTKRTGFSTELVLKRSDYGMDKLMPAVGDDIHIAVSFEGTKK
jgi:polyisoprenoid-binding protein YceI